MTKPRVLVDTGAWLAAFNRRDQYHADGAAELRRLRGERVPLIVSNLIMAELHLHLLYGLGAQRAADHLATLKTDPMIEEVFADQALQESALIDWIRRFADQTFTLTDAVSFALMQAQEVQSAFTFDHHFAVAGFRTVPEMRSRRRRTSPK